MPCEEQVEKYVFQVEHSIRLRGRSLAARLVVRDLGFDVPAPCCQDLEAQRAETTDCTMGRAMGCCRL